MNVLRSLKSWLVVLAFALVLTGCGSVQDPVNPAEPWNPGMTSSSPQPYTAAEPPPVAPTRPPPSPRVDVPVSVPKPVVTDTNAVRRDDMANVLLSGSALRVGDLVKVTFSDINPAWPVHSERIQEDGYITLPLNVRVLAAGRTAGQLQTDIRNKYVPELFHYLTVTVLTDDLIFFVGGEVRTPGRQLFSPAMTVTRAIDTAGGFTEFSNRKKIELIRANGTKLKINYDKALKNGKLDHDVYPGDRIYVPVRGVFN